ncbi:MAG: cation transporter [Thiomicrorhabdus chilensis]|uniref:cation diffusion facilitator family transporter n=1 Tax=Thiomicrorhabdus chilensis TaxID=63656 RepID=UPI00299E1C8D|nr:cation transporter [Thiomicrorhabdus chilensis]MDX1348011.1 cation transporter [Thiomicrorhabdus chilensis]
MQTRSTDSLEKRVQTEKKAIKWVMVGDLLLAVLGITFFYLTNSQAILMDGVYPLIDLIAGLLTLRVVTLITQQASESQPFGYAIFEPVLNFIKGILILLVVLVALYASVFALFHGGRQIEANIAVFYSIVASVLGFALSYGLHRMNKTAKSSLIDVDLKGWLIGSVLSVAVGLSFALAIWMETTQYKSWVPYVDPLVILILILVVLPMPLQILKHNGMQIVGRTGNDEASQFLQSQVEAVFASVEYSDIKTRYLQAGRMMYVQVYVQMQADTDFDLLEQDRYRDALFQHLKQTHDYLSLDVIYTTHPIWVARSVGLADGHAQNTQT